MGYFSVHEVRCRCSECGCDKCKARPDVCDAQPLSLDLLMKANTLRVLYGSPLNPSSARRCRYWNAHKGVDGSSKSQHLYGNAIDFLVYDRRDQERLAELAEKVGFGGIGLYDWGVHVDVGPANRRWDFRK